MVEIIWQIAFLSLVFSAISTFVNHKIGGRKRVKALQKEVNDFQKKFEKATREKDEKELQHLKILEPAVMKNMQEMLFLPLKGMLVILPLFFILITAVVSFFPGFVIALPIGLHPDELFALRVFNESLYGPRGFFIVVSIVFNLFFELVYSKLIENKGKEVKP
ncbi:DUF106 domain-containing protein [Candidatus Micrarchaeota archaeon]|nr:DUF106 domain-containing protein [Candidatus Micrarchaeota archaeon]